jgi:hypothetical protein
MTGDQVFLGSVQSAPHVSGALPAFATGPARMHRGAGRGCTAAPGVDANSACVCVHVAYLTHQCRGCRCLVAHVRAAHRALSRSDPQSNLNVTVTMTLPKEAAGNASEAVAPGGSFSQGLGSNLELAGVIPPGTAGNILRRCSDRCARRLKGDGVCAARVMGAPQKGAGFRPLLPPLRRVS